jgi:hypothetical protein
MENFTIYKNGKYDTIANLKIKINKQLPVVADRIDTFFRTQGGNYSKY